MHPAETYRRRAERAQRTFENARDPKAKRLARVAAQRWRQLAEFAQRQETDASQSEQGEGLAISPDRAT